MMATPFRLLACLGTIAALFFSSVPALSVLRIVPDQFPTIQSAINAAAPGDSIMVRAGTYVESLALSGKNLTIFGVGSQATIVTTNFTARVATLGSGVTAQTVLSDLTIRQGLAGDGGGMILTGGASPVLRRCRLVENWAYRSEGSTWGGAILVGSGSQLLIEDCVFYQNLADYFCCNVPGQGHGGAISASSGSTIRVVRTEFVQNYAQGFEGGWGGAIHVASNATAVIEDCRFEANGGSGGGVGAESANVTIDRCVFTENSGYNGAALATGGRTIVRSSLFYDNDNWPFPWTAVVAIGYSALPGEFSNNTVAFNQGGGVFTSHDVAKNNIIVGNNGVGLRGDIQQPGSFSCNDVWNNAENYAGPDLTGIDGNISVDPLFCDAAGRDLHLHQSSPCAAPGACGLIGALGIACGVAGVDPGAMVSQPLRLLIDPNPMTAAGGQLTLIGGNGPATIEIVNAQGRVVERIVSKVNHRTAWTPESKLAAGVYFARVQVRGASSVTKFLIIR